MTVLRALASVALLGLSTPVFAQGSQVAFGVVRQDTSAPVEVSADELSIDQDTGEALFSGNVMIGQGEMRLSAAQVFVIYKEDQSGIQQLRATGGITLVSGQDAAEAQQADYNVDAGVIVLTGDVLVLQGKTPLSADKMTVNLDTGAARLQGRVRTVLQNGSD